MAADIKPKTLVSDRPCESPDILRVSFQDPNRVALARKLVSSRKTRGPRSDNDYALAGSEHQIKMGAWRGQDTRGAP